MKFPRSFVVGLSLCSLAAMYGAWRPSVSRAQTPTAAPMESAVTDNARQMLDEGRRVFRYETFGDEAYWGDTLKLHRVEAACIPANIASIGLLEKTGFKREGFARQYLCIDGIWQDHLLYAKLESDH